MTHLAPSVHTFEAIEQLDEWHRELNWPLQYRQIEAGSLASTFTNVEGDNWFLMEEQSNRQFEIEAASPDGMFMLAVLDGKPANIGGRAVGNDRLLLQAPNSDFVVTLPADTVATQVGITEEVFEEMVDAVAPDLAVPRGDIAIFDAPGRLASVQRAMRETIKTPSNREATREEAVSRILVNLIAATSDQCQVQARCDLRRAAAVRVLDKAREYIEANLSAAIRVTSISHYAGTSLRSLERIFDRELGMSPSQYVTARRLNAVRRRLLAAAEDQGLRVTDVAHGYGFAHLGRFAGHYRRYFGESPRETLLSR